MLSQLDLLKEALQERLEANGGRETPFVQGLRAQIARYEKPPAENPMEVYSMGMRNPRPSPKSSQTP
jgi:hypothetical protein